MAQLFANNAYGVLAGTVNGAATLLVLVSGQGARFPAPTGGDHFLATLVGLDGNGAESAWEIVKCTGRSTDQLTVVRAQEGTTATTWNAGTRIEVRWTKAGVDGKENAGVAVALDTAHTSAPDPHPQYTTTAEAAAAAPVQSVAGKTGTITLVKADVGLGNVDNTSDAAKPVSTAQLAALNLKANLASPTLTGVPTAPTAVVGTNTTQLATTAFVNAERSNAVTLTNKTLTSPVLTTESVSVVTNNLPAIRPSLLLDFANSKTVDTRINFTRASTATYFDAQGLMRTAASGVPRINHDPVTGECKGLLIEESRTNRCPFSADVGFDGWGNGSNIQVLGRAIAPDGTNTATVFGYLATGNAFSATFRPVSAGETVTASAYIRLKAGTLQSGTSASLIVGDALGVISALYTGAEGTPVLDGTWRRHSITITNGNAAGNLIFYVAADFAPGVEIEVWGAQIETGAFPSSYIPTTTAEVTRAADIAYISQDKLPAFTKPNSGTVSAEYSIQGFSKTTIAEHPVVTIGFEGGNYAARLRSYSNAVGGYDSDATIKYPNYPFDSDVSNRAEAGIKVSSAVSYGSKGVTASVFGEFKGTHATPFTPAQHSVISLGNFYNTGFLNGHLRRVAYFPAELSVTELNALTSA